jgi:hypothetical protein
MVLCSLVHLFMYLSIIKKKITLQGCNKMFRDNSAMRKHLHTHGPRVGLLLILVIISGVPIIENID